MRCLERDNPQSGDRSVICCGQRTGVITDCQAQDCAPPAPGHHHSIMATARDVNQEIFIGSGFKCCLKCSRYIQYHILCSNIETCRKLLWLPVYYTTRKFQLPYPDMCNVAALVVNGGGGARCGWKCQCRCCWIVSWQHRHLQISDMCTSWHLHTAPQGGAPPSWDKLTIYVGDKLIDVNISYLVP